MPTKDLQTELDRLHAALGFKRLNPLWAKFEILFGLIAAGMSMIVAVQLAVRPDSEVSGIAWLGPLLLFVLGWYLALAGHRSHLYQSANLLAAYNAMLKR